MRPSALLPRVCAALVALSFAPSCSKSSSSSPRSDGGPLAPSFDDVPVTGTSHLADEAELWRRNENHAVPTTHDPIAKGADEHVVYGP